MSEMHECPDCWDAFDTERGVKVHQSKAHGSVTYGTSREDLLEELERVADEAGRTPRVSDLKEYGEWSKRPFERVFGSWTAALEAAGFDPNKRRDIPKSDLLEELHRVADQLGRVPRIKDMNSHGEYSNRPYQRTFGSWNNALEEAGFETHIQHDLSRDDLIDELQRVGEVVGRVPEVSDMNSTGGFSHRVYYIYFESWGEALREAGFDPTHVPTPRSELIAELQRVGEELGRGPPARKMEVESKFGSWKYEREFGSWSNALEAAGFERREHGAVGEDHPPVGRWVLPIRGRVERIEARGGS